MLPFDDGGNMGSFFSKAVVVVWLLGFVSGSLLDVLSSSSSRSSLGLFLLPGELSRLVRCASLLPTIGKSLRGLEALAECVAVTWEYTAAGEGSSDEGKSSECCFSGGPGFTGAWFAALVGGGGGFLVGGARE